MTRLSVHDSPAGRVAVVALMVFPLGGCFGDPPPDPATAPVEVVLDKCTLGRPDVAPGKHTVVAIRYQGNGSGSVVVTDKNDAEILTVASGDSAELVTTEQTYTFTCTVGADINTATLESKP